MFWSRKQENGWLKLEPSKKNLPWNEYFKGFVSMASHEISAPIRHIRFFADQIKEKINSEDSDSKKHLKLMDRAAQRLDNIRISMMTLVRAQTIEDPEPLEGSQLIAWSHSHCELSKPQDKNLKLEILISPDTIYNCSFIKDVFQEILNNSIFFSNKHSIEISVKQTITENHCEIIFSDNGPGILPPYHKQIFLPFKKLDNESQNNRAGLGLTICEIYLKRLNGQIQSLSSQEGAKFKITLPLSFIVN